LIWQRVLVEGYALNCTVASQQMPKRITEAKIAFLGIPSPAPTLFFFFFFLSALDFNLNKQKMAMGVVLNPGDTAKLEGIRDRESDIIKERIQMILKAGANVILTTKGIDALCLKYCML
jgi:T-complex protein 1 subunit alpha